MIVLSQSESVWAGKIPLYSHLHFLYKRGKGGGEVNSGFPGALCFSPCPSNSTQIQSNRKCTAVVVMLLGYRESIYCVHHQIFRAVNAPYYCNYTTHTFSTLFLSNNAQNAGPSQEWNRISICNKPNITQNLKVILVLTFPHPVLIYWPSFTFQTCNLFMSLTENGKYLLWLHVTRFQWVIQFKTGSISVHIQVKYTSCLKSLQIFSIIRPVSLISSVKLDAVLSYSVCWLSTLALGILDTKGNRLIWRV